jgi:hypothetical protein
VQRDGAVTGSFEDLATLLARGFEAGIRVGLGRGDRRSHRALGLEDPVDRLGDR